jgi:serine/threonine protein kinase
VSTVERLDWTLQQYSIGHLIASGHFGVVYQAQHLPTGRDVALKLIPLQGQDSDEKVAAERHGAVLQQRFSLTHPGLVPEVFEHQTIVPFYAIAMELVRGRQLTSLIAGGRLPSRRAAEIALAVASFLSKAHQFETDIEQQHYALIVHADLKPDHILLLEDGSIRVLDFGIAKALATRTLVTTNKWGSVQYASPERLQSDGHVNEHVDFWSLGVMLFEMAAGFRPYRQYEQNPSLLDRAIRKQETREPVPADVEPALAAIIHKLLAPQIERRYASADAIAQDLSAFLSGGPTMAGLEHAQASVETVRIGGPATLEGSAQAPAVLPRRPDSVPTEPLPKHSQSEAPTAQANAAQPAAAARPPQHRFARPLRAAATLVVLGSLTSEGLALVRAEQLMGQIPALEVPDLDRAREEYRRIDGWTPLGLGAGRVSGPLTRRMIELADRAILEFRADAPAIAQAQWEQAARCLSLATEISPSDRVVAGKRAYVQGQLARIADRNDEAIRHFRTASRLLPRDPDPYLGLATIYVYVTTDLEGFTQALRDAEERGFVGGRRVRIWAGDLHLKLGERGQAEARRLTGDERVEQLQRAAADYQKCIQYFDGLRAFNSERNLRTCRRRLADVQGQLPPPVPPVDFPFGAGGV